MKVYSFVFFLFFINLILSFLFTGESLAKSFYSKKLMSFNIEVPSEVDIAINAGGLNKVFSSDCKIWSQQIDVNLQKNIKRCIENNHKNILLFGDSHAIEVHNSLYLQQPNYNIFTIAKPGCRFSEIKSQCGYYGSISDLQNQHNFDQIFYLQSGSYQVVNNIIQKNQIDRLYEQLKEINNIVVLGPIVQPITDIRSLNWLFHDLNDLQLQIRKYKSIELLDEYLKNKSLKEQIDYISLIDVLEFDSESDIYNETIFFTDSDHWTTEGEKKFGKKLKKILN